MDKNKLQKAYSKLVAKAWSDDNFKAQLLSDPMTVFKENDLIIPEGVEVRIVENSPKIIHFILPSVPSDELNDDELECAGGYHHNILYT